MATALGSDIVVVVFGLDGSWPVFPEEPVSTTGDVALPSVVLAEDDDRAVRGRAT
jgi:hypothetical protein